MKYRPKSVAVEAFQFNGDFLNIEEAKENNVPNWAIEAIKSGIMGVCNSFIYIESGEGYHIASVGDFVVRGEKGKLFTCKHEDFREMYEPLE